MVDLPQILGIASIRKFCKSYQSLLRKCYQISSSKKPHIQSYKVEDPPGEEDIATKRKIEKRKTMSLRYNSQNIQVDDPDDDGDDRRSQNNMYNKHRNASNYFSSSYPPPSFLGKIPSTRNSSKNNIMFSSSSGMLKPPPIEKNLECTLEELCYGCQKKLKITRDVVKDLGRIVQEEELLTIKVKPGWKKGTKITFQGMGNEKPGSYPADIIFIIAEKRHQLFRREGDDLEFAIRIPLVKALTGCKISIPLLGGEKMKLSVDEIIQPGFVKIVPNQGMTIAKDPEKRRGDLRVVFLVDFPIKLSDDQRLDVLSILQDEG